MNDAMTEFSYNTNSNNLPVSTMGGMLHRARVGEMASSGTAGQQSDRITSAASQHQLEHQLQVSLWGVTHHPEVTQYTAQHYLLLQQSEPLTCKHTPADTSGSGPNIKQWKADEVHASCQRYTANESIVLTR